MDLEMVPAAAPTLKEPARHFLTSADFRECAVKHWVEVDFEGFLVGA
jgi:hypothetical protein